MEQEQVEGDAPQPAMEQEQATGDSLQPAAASAGTRRMTGREAVLAVVAVVAVIAAVVGFALYGGTRVPADAAAKVGDTYITEVSVADWIAQYRAAYSLEDDADFASALQEQSLSAAAFRQNAVNQLALAVLIDQRAEEMGVTPSDEEAQAQVDATKESMAFGDDSIWTDTLASYGLTEDGLRAQYRTNLAEQVICEADVARRDATEDEALSYAQTYLAGTTQKHACRIVFTGDDASDRAQECYEQLLAAQEAGDADADTFSEFARANSDEEGVQDTGGSLAWSGDNVMGDEIMEVLEDLDVGSFTGPESIEADDAVEIIYCDEEYAFPSSDDFSSLAADDIPESLMAAIADAASDELWTSDCSAYLAALLAAVKITYYPIPDDATYDVDMSLASS